ncbi:MAG: GNAT family N-acetyltransferase [Agathobaculum sp.]|uniref:N-acetyltransferase family protein n=1 Tax=Agathobaculum sp. TaxID=2048138 RepID=UPI003D919D7A
MPEVVLRVAEEKDAAAMLALYAPYVIQTTVSSEYEPPSLDEFLGRMRSYTTKLPWLVCTVDGQVAGYGYAAPHRTRAAYQWSVETSIYVEESWHRCGIAGAIYAALFELLAMQGYYNIFVGITSPNERSMKFHKAMGFIISGAYQESMFKFGQWRDVLWMGKSLRAHEGEPQPTVPFPEIKDSPLVARALRQAEQRIHL